MSDFNDVVKYLRFRKGHKATPGELLSSPNQTSLNPLKYESIVKGRPIKLINTTLNFPPHTYNKPILGNRLFPRLLFQYNISLDANFYVLKSELNYPSLYVPHGGPCIKWRNGTTVHRYKLFDGTLRANNADTGNNKVELNFTRYSNQLVPPNFVIEWWFCPFVQQPNLIGNVFGMKFTISTLSVPMVPEQTEIALTYNSPLEIADMGFNLPVSFPISQPDIVWLDN